MQYGLVIRVRSNGKIRKFGVLDSYGNIIQMTYSELMKHVRKGEIVNLAPNGDYYTGKNCAVTDIPTFDENMTQISGIQYDNYYNIVANEIYRQNTEKEQQAFNEQAQEEEQQAFEEQQKFNGQAQDRVFSSINNKQTVDDYGLSAGIEMVTKFGNSARKEVNKRLNRGKYLGYLEKVEQLLDNIEHYVYECLRAKRQANEKLRQYGFNVYNRQMDALTCDSKINDYILRYGIMEFRNRLAAMYTQAKNIIDSELTSRDKEFYTGRLQECKKSIYDIQELHKETSSILKENIKLREEKAEQERLEQERIKEEQAVNNLLNEISNKLAFLETDISNVNVALGEAALNRVKTLENKSERLFEDSKANPKVHELLSDRMSSLFSIIEDTKCRVDEFIKEQEEQKRIEDERRKQEEKQRLEEEKRRKDMLEQLDKEYEELLSEIEKCTDYSEFGALKSRISTFGLSDVPETEEYKEKLLAELTKAISKKERDDLREYQSNALASLEETRKLIDNAKTIEELDTISNELTNFETKDILVLKMALENTRKAINNKVKEIEKEQEKADKEQVLKVYETLKEAIDSITELEEVGQIREDIQSFDDKGITYRDLPLGVDLERRLENKRQKLRKEKEKALLEQLRQELAMMESITDLGELNRTHGIMQETFYLLKFNDEYEEINKTYHKVKDTILEKRFLDEVVNVVNSLAFKDLEMTSYFTYKDDEISTRKCLDVIKSRIDLDDRVRDNNRFNEALEQYRDRCNKELRHRKKKEEQEKKARELELAVHKAIETINSLELRKTYKEITSTINNVKEQLDRNVINDDRVKKAFEDYKQHCNKVSRALALEDTMVLQYVGLKTSTSIEKSNIANVKTQEAFDRALKRVENSIYEASDRIDKHEFFDINVKSKCKDKIDRYIYSMEDALNEVKLRLKN